LALGWCRGSGVQFRTTVWLDRIGRVFGLLHLPQACLLNGRTIGKYTWLSLVVQLALKAGANIAGVATNRRTEPRFGPIGFCQRCECLARPERMLPLIAAQRESRIEYILQLTWIEPVRCCSDFGWTRHAGIVNGVRLDVRLTVRLAQGATCVSLNAIAITGCESPKSDKHRNRFKIHVNCRNIRYRLRCAHKRGAYFCGKASIVDKSQWPESGFRSAIS